MSTNSLKISPSKWHLSTSDSISFKTCARWNNADLKFLYSIELDGNDVIPVENLDLTQKLAYFKIPYLDDFLIHGLT